MTFFDFITPLSSFIWGSSRAKVRPIPRGINLSDSLRTYIVFPIAGYLPFPETGGYAEYPDAHTTTTISYQPTLASSPIEWSVHGAAFGVVFYIYPIFSSPIAPNRIEVVVPDQLEWPVHLWAPLKAGESVHLRGHRVADLPISKHLIHALSFWSCRTADFERRYRALLFGSRIVLPHLDIHPAKIQITFNEDTKPFHKMLSVSQLCEKWDMKVSAMPPCLTVSQLHHIRQIADDVALVQRVDPELDTTTLIFKSAVDDLNPLYHELKVLLTMPPAPTIVEAPSHLVTTQFGHDCEDLVCGFLIQYYPLGSLEEILPERRINQSLHIRKQLGWAIDITRGLLHVHDNAGRYCSDLRMDNAVLRRNEDGSESVVLIDFQQSRNLYNWAPPEIYYTEWIAELGHDDFARGPPPSSEIKAYYNKLLSHMLSVRKYPQPLCKEPEIYDNADQGWYFPWLMCSPEERDSSQVYLLGKALWCIFEGASTPDIVLGRSYPHELDIRFPSFQRTPEPLQDLIRNCTLGAREWLDGPLGIFRRDGKIFPLGKTGLHNEEEATTEETKAAIARTWQNEMMKAEQFVLARARHDQAEATAEDLQLLHYLRRPKLREVLDALTAFDPSFV